MPAGIDLARENRWDAASYVRPREVKRTHLSCTLFDAFLGFGDRAFTVPLAQLFDEEGDGRYLPGTRRGCVAW